MKKITIIFSITMLFVLLGFNSTKAATIYINGISWDISNCSCTDPSTYDVRIVIIDIDTQQSVHDSGWQTDVSEPYHYTADNVDIKTDCSEPCYTVFVYVRVNDNGGECCSGYDSDDVTGQTLTGGSYNFGEIVL